jgi:hypothetical protein
MLHMCVCTYSHFVENHPIRILENGPGGSVTSLHAAAPAIKGAGRCWRPLFSSVPLFPLQGAHTTSLWPPASCLSWSPGPPSLPHLGELHPCHLPYFYRTAPHLPPSTSVLQEVTAATEGHRRSSPSSKHCRPTCVCRLTDDPPLQWAAALLLLPGASSYQRSFSCRRSWRTSLPESTSTTAPSSRAARRRGPRVLCRVGRCGSRRPIGPLGLAAPS